jgi:hypothetical protein
VFIWESCRDETLSRCSAFSNGRLRVHRQRQYRRGDLQEPTNDQRFDSAANDREFMIFGETKTDAPMLDSQRLELLVRSYQIEKTRESRESIFCQIVELVHPYLLCLVIRVSGHEITGESPEGLVNAVILILPRVLFSFDTTGKSRFVSYLGASCQNRVRDLIRKCNRGVTYMEHTKAGVLLDRITYGSFSSSY